MAMAYHLVHLDESGSDHTRTWALTAVCVPLDSYDTVRSAYYEVVRLLIQPEPNAIETAPPELHGVNLLRDHPGVDDAPRLEVARGIANLVIDHALPVIRYGRRYRPGRRPDSKTLKIGTWLGIRLRILERPENERFVLVMDGFDPETVREMSGLVHATDVMHAAGMGDPNDPRFRQIIGEVFYADGRYSIMTQVADVIGYLRHVSDKQRAGLALSEFGQQLLAVSRTLDRAMTVERIDDMPA